MKNFNRNDLSVEELISKSVLFLLASINILHHFHKRMSILFFGFEISPADDLPPGNSIHAVVPIAAIKMVHFIDLFLDPAIENIVLFEGQVNLKILLCLSVSFEIGLVKQSAHLLWS